MQAYCSNCDAKITSADRFCGACGTSVIPKCPTCGQPWGEQNLNTTLHVKESKASKKEMKESITEKVFVDAPIHSNVRLTSAQIDPVYGPAFNQKNDCANCGARDARKGNCKICGNNA